MSNPTELPDLDAVHLANLVRAAGYEMAASEYQHAWNLAKGGPGLEDRISKSEKEFLAAVEKITDRRAQPEGEAPQVDAMVVPRELLARCLTSMRHAVTFGDTGKGRPPSQTCMLEIEELAALLSAPAAQHAESGAPVAADERVDTIVTGLYRRFKDWSKRGFGADDVTWCEVKADVVALIAAQSQGAPALTPLDYRAQGREEALAIILSESAEDPFSAYTGWSKSGAPDDEGGAHWKEDELRALLHIGDRTHDAYDRAEGAYWEALGRKDEAARELLFAQQAPFYKPLHDFLSKHEAWDLMADLKRAQQAAAPGALPGEALRMSTTDARGYLVDFMMEHFSDKTFHRYIRGEGRTNFLAGDFAWQMATALRKLEAAPSAPGTPEAPKGGV